MRGSDEEAARITREIAERAIRRLDVLEWFIFGGAAVVAMIGGALIALLLAEPLGFGFRATWLVASITFFVIPGGIAVTVLRRQERARRKQFDLTQPEPPEDG